MKKVNDCDHLRVAIVAIERAWSFWTRSRRLRGHCKDCGGEVYREQTQEEIDTGKTEPWR